MKTPAIQVWAFEEAPKYLQNLSKNCGDEDWIAVLPPTVWGVNWLREGGEFARCKALEYSHPKKAGYKVIIGCHS